MAFNDFIALAEKIFNIHMIKVFKIIGSKLERRKAILRIIRPLYSVFAVKHKNHFVVMRVYNF
ncbi:protein of unknown function [Chryseobacterium sp. JV274]|nr:protein of unknown function [Chryseobacterium sp. JV274]